MPVPRAKSMVIKPDIIMLRKNFFLTPIFSITILLAAMSAASGSSSTSRPSNTTTVNPLSLGTALNKRVIKKINKVPGIHLPPSDKTGPAELADDPGEEGLKLPSDDEGGIDASPTENLGAKFEDASSASKSKEDRELQELQVDTDLMMSDCGCKKCCLKSLSLEDKQNIPALRERVHAADGQPYLFNLLQTNTSRENSNAGRPFRTYWLFTKNICRKAFEI